MVSCCIDCFERCVSFLSKQAYVEITIRSCSYCSGACKSMSLYLDYIAEFSLIDGAVECSTTIACFVISIGCTVVCSLIVDNVESVNIQLEETFTPKIVTFFTTLVVAKMF